MRALLLAGGKGTRLLPHTAKIPKPLLPLGELPIIEIVLRQLASCGFDRVTLLLNHLHHLFAGVLGDGQKYGLDIDYVGEDAVLGTAGSIALVQDLPDDFIVMNGDLLTTLDYRNLFMSHCESENIGSIATNRRVHKVDFGVVESNNKKELVAFKEKPELAYNVSMGVNVLNRKCLKFIQSGVYLDMPDLMTNMNDAGLMVRVFEQDCYWQDIGRPDDYEKAALDFEADPNMFLNLYS